MDLLWFAGFGFVSSSFVVGLCAICFVVVWLRYCLLFVNSVDFVRLLFCGALCDCMFLFCLL